MIVIKTSQNIIRRSKAHTFLTTRIVNRVSLILIVWLSPRKKKESLRYNQFSLLASRYRCFLIFLLIVSHLRFFWQISRKRQRKRLWLRDIHITGWSFGLDEQKTTTHSINEFQFSFSYFSPMIFRCRFPFQIKESLIINFDDGMMQIRA